jgi:polyribonucleotide nucleotidyltransferase
MPSANGLQGDRHADGITALQMDIKVQGINEAIIRDGLRQALEARPEILER